MDIIPQYLLGRMLSIIFSYGFFSLFSTSLVMISIEVVYQYVSSMDNSVPLRDREMQLADLNLLIILEMHSSTALKSAAYLCLFS